MTATLTTNPPYAMAGGAVPVTCGADATGANFVRVYFTKGPADSRLQKQLEQLDSLRIEVAAVDAGDTKELPLDKPGAYTFLVQEITRGAAAAYGGGYEGDPSSFTTETQVGSEQTVTVYIGERWVVRIGHPSFGTAQLIVHVWNDTVRATSKALHGEKTPAIVAPTNALALAAAGDASVVAALSALADTNVSSWTSTLPTLFAELATDMAAHFIDETVHNAIDQVNDTALEDLPGDPSSPEGWGRAASIMARALRGHFTNDGESLTGSSRYHQPADYANLSSVLVPSGTGADRIGMMMTVAGVYLAYEAHRQDAAIHNAADSTNVIASSLGVFLELLRAFLAALKLLQPAAAAEQNAGGVRLAALGFTQ